MLPLSGSVGGDHLIYVDFKQRFDLDARIALAREQGRHDVGGATSNGAAARPASRWWTCRATA